MLRYLLDRLGNSLRIKRYHGIAEFQAQRFRQRGDRIRR